MCDCYGHECAVEGCQETVSIHIGDFAYPRDRFKVWCNNHIDQADVGAVVFRLTKRSREENLPKGWACAILGPDVGGDGDNHPNLYADFEEAIVQ